MRTYVGGKGRNGQMGGEKLEWNGGFCNQFSTVPFLPIRSYGKGLWGKWGLPDSVGRMSPPPVALPGEPAVEQSQETLNGVFGN